MTSSAILLKQYCDCLLDPQSGWEERRQILQQMHDLFVALGAFNAYNEELRSPKIDVGSGAAIAPIWAAMCLFDIARTRQFVAGIKEAIADTSAAQKGKQVQVLDAGCGPYGLLSLLPALYFSPAEVQFTLLDIFPGNVNSARTLINALGMQPYFAELVCTDALTYTWPQQTPLHILVTETMNRALSKEPQVAISLHLSPQLAPGGILIPEAVEVRLKCIDRKKRNEISQSVAEGDELPHHLYMEDLGLVIRLNKVSTEVGVSQRPLCTIQLPAYFNAEQYQLELDTHVRIYKEYELGRNESGITLPYVIARDIKIKLQMDESLSFNYELSGEPGISHSF